MVEGHFEHPTTKGDPPSRLLVGLVLAGAILAVYWRTVGFEFVNYDDRGFVRDNGWVRAGLTWQGFLWAFRTHNEANWHPLTWLSLMLDAQVGGSNPAIFHATNVLLHILGTLFLFLAFDHMTGSRWKSAFVAAVFAVHPLHVESVAWVAERKDVLSTAFWFLTLLAYARRAQRPGFGADLAVAASFTLGLLAKPMLVTLPLVLLLIDYWPLKRFETWILVREKALLFLLSAVFSVITVASQRLSLVPLETHPLTIRIENAVMTYVAYLGRTFWPSGLAVFYPYPEGTISLGAVALAALLLLAVTAAVLLEARRRPYLIVGWLWYVGTLVPVIGLVQVGLQASADRYMYVPLVGISIMVAWGFPDRVRAAVSAAAGLIAVVALMAVAFVQTSYWRNSITLNERAVSVTRNNTVALHNLAEGLYQQGRIDEAIERCREALRINPGFLDARASLAAGLYKQGSVAEAVREFEEVLRVSPNHARARYNVGVIRLKEGKLEEALDHLLVAVRASPDDPESQVNLGVVFGKLERFDEAIARFEEALRLDPENESARKNLELARSRRDGR